MNITIFNELTTDDYLNELQAEADKYQGLYVDMDNADERKYVKDKASSISSLLKSLDRARIDKSKEYKLQVETEAGIIKDRLEKANLPFTLLIDDHNEKRKQILADKKAIDDAKALIIEIEINHDEAINIDKLWGFEKADRLRVQKEHDDEIRNKAIKQATIDAENKVIRDAEIVATDRKMREADTDHKRGINVIAVAGFTDHGFSSDEAMKIVSIIAKGFINNVTINY